jgi:endonuclease/exonuclease/phosphatase family metal-dependent hydrolase
MRLTAALLNLQHGGAGKGGDRWPLIAERLGNAQADVTLLNEALGWQECDGELLKRAERDLGMTALRPLPPARSGHHVVIMYRPGTLGAPQDYNVDFAAQCEHGMAVAAWDIGLPRPLAICTAHLSPFSPAEALIEAQKARWTSLRYGDRNNDDHYYSIIGADFNSPPLFRSAADVKRMNVLDRAARFADAAGTIPDTGIARAFADVGFTDTAEILYQQDKDERHLARTGRSDRIDRILVTERLRRAVVRGARLDTPAGAADHDGLDVTIDTDLIDISPR